MRPAQTPADIDVGRYRDRELIGTLTGRMPRVLIESIGPVTAPGSADAEAELLDRSAVGRRIGRRERQGVAAGR